MLGLLFFYAYCWIIAHVEIHGVYTVSMRVEIAIELQRHCLEIACRNEKNVGIACKNTIVTLTHRVRDHFKCLPKFIISTVSHRAVSYGSWLQVPKISWFETKFQTALFFNSDAQKYSFQLKI